MFSYSCTAEKFSFFFFRLLLFFVPYVVSKSVIPRRRNVPVVKETLSDNESNLSNVFFMFCSAKLEE